MKGVSLGSVFPWVPLAVRLREHRHSLKEGLPEKSILAQHAYEEGHRIGWDESAILEIESKSRHRNTKNRPIWHA
jgi:hypothetical protein